jgi:hypothetical protein
MAGIRNIGLGPEITEWADTLELAGIRQDGKESGNMIIMGPGSPCDGYVHYLIPPNVWKKNAKKGKAKKGRYVVFTWANWSPIQDEDEVCDSVMEMVSSNVDMLEAMVVNGEVDEDPDIDEESSEP